MMTPVEKEELREYGGDLYVRAIAFKERLANLGVKIELESNVPWIYLHSVNGNRIKKRYGAEHGYCVGLTGVRKDSKGSFWDLKHLFKTVRGNI